MPECSWLLFCGLRQRLPQVPKPRKLRQPSVPRPRHPHRASPELLRMRISSRQRSSRSPEKAAFRQMAPLRLRTVLRRRVLLRPPRKARRSLRTRSFHFRAIRVRQGLPLDPAQVPAAAQATATRTRQTRRAVRMPRANPNSRTREAKDSRLFPAVIFCIGSIRRGPSCRARRNGPRRILMSHTSTWIAATFRRPTCAARTP